MTSVESGSSVASSVGEIKRLPEDLVGNPRKDTDEYSNSDDGCFCLFCVDHPRFPSEEEYFEHYRLCHEENERKKKQNVKDDDKERSVLNSKFDFTVVQCISKKLKDN